MVPRKSWVSENFSPMARNMRHLRPTVTSGHSTKNTREKENGGQAKKCSGLRSAEFFVVCGLV